MSDYATPEWKDMKILGGPPVGAAQKHAIANNEKPNLKPGQILLSPKQAEQWRVLSAPGVRYSAAYGGSRSGKTFLITRALCARAIKAPGTRHIVLRSHANAARNSIALNSIPTVMKICFPTVKLSQQRQDGYFTFPNGSELWYGGLDDSDRVEKILGNEYASLFFNEASQIAYSAVKVGLTRLAQVHPAITQRCYVDLNPVGKKHWTNLLFNLGQNPDNGTPLRDPESYLACNLNPVDNAHNLDKAYLDSLAYADEKTRKRFFLGQYVDEVEGALWSYDQIEANRRSEDDIPVSKRQAVVVAIDPSGASSADDTDHDEIGIVVMARGTDGHGYVLADESLRDGPLGWATKAVTAYYRYQADCIVAEGNFGGAMVESNIKAVDPNIPVRLVSASRGKIVRAEPISALAEIGRIHHVGKFEKLEDQLCAFASGGYKAAGSPDHADAFIWAATHLLSAATNIGFIEYYRRLAEEEGASRIAP